MWEESPQALWGRECPSYLDTNEAPLSTVHALERWPGNLHRSRHTDLPILPSQPQGQGPGNGPSWRHSLECARQWAKLSPLL